MTDEPVSGVLDVSFTIYEALAPIITSAIAWVALKFSTYIREKIRNDKASGLMARLNDSVFEAVTAVHQQQADLLHEYRKVSSPSGQKLSKTEAMILKEAAWGYIRSYWGPRGMRELAEVLGYAPNSLLATSGLDSVIDAKIESSVSMSKRLLKP